ncbi:MAG: hypothetical protein COY80_00970 [Candidatus Pacebacteria bacterium CG_4_10_14_0_8_um_filter_42_14]|nr:MAG: hypothetical protein COY80_00970 [Candidatus Pacebacteria bacterium CG_4_10_14_0_8_um_filter_42_14]
MTTILRFRYLIISLAIITGIGLRAYQIDKYPMQYNGDDQTHAMVGVSILSKDHSPAGTTLFISDNPSLFWFSHVDYFDTIRRYDFRLSEPYLDQPPLAISIIGILPTLFGYDHFQPIPQALVTLPALIAGIFSMYLVFVLSHKLLDKNEALFATIFYSLSLYYICTSSGSIRKFLNSHLSISLYFIIRSHQKSKKNNTLILIFNLFDRWICKTNWLNFASYYLFLVN